MRLSEWRAAAPHKDSMGPKVVAVIEPILAALGVGRDPECFVLWGEDPAQRYLVMAPTRAGLASINVRVNVPQEGPRASGKLTRWPRVQIGELALESTGTHWLVSAQVEGQVLRGADDEAERIASFIESLIEAIDGRAQPAPDSAG